MDLFDSSYVRVSTITAIQVHTAERTQVHSAQSSLVVTHPSTNRAFAKYRWLNENGTMMMQ